VWGTDHWSPRPVPPGSHWGSTWRWWYQYAGETHTSWDITRYVVEARWTTDSLTPGDGTFRGDLQPGRLELKLFGDLSSIPVDILGCVWARYTPSGATWCWFLNDFTSLLTAPGESRPYLVWTADSWPARLTQAAYNAGRPRETVTQRLNFIANEFATDTGLALPPFNAAQIAGDNSQIQATVQDNYGHWPPWLQQVRDAAQNGVAWLSATAGNNPGDAGSLTLNYVRLGSSTTRTILNSDIDTDSIWTSSLDDIVTFIVWNGVAFTGVANTLTQTGGYWAQGGIKTFTARMLGDLASGGSHVPTATQNGNNVLTARSWNRQRVDQIVCTSGDRSTPLGVASVPWAPQSMVWGPNEVMSWTRSTGAQPDLYRVENTAHVLNARVWEATHTLTPYIAEVPFP
jgi:hypothetical protein